MNHSRWTTCLAGILFGIFCTCLWAEAGSNNPPHNPFLADSHWGIFHGNPAQTAYSPVSGPAGPTRTLGDDEIVWRPVGPSNSYDLKYTGVYPDGGRVSWIGGSDQIFKLDTATLEIIAAYALRPGPVWTQEQANAEVNALDALTFEAEADPENVPALARRVADTLSPILRSTGSGAIYNLLSNDNEYYTLTWEPAEKQGYLSVFGDAVAGQRTSPIEFKRRWALPRAGSKGIAINMTYDGWVIIATFDGLVYAVSRDFQGYHELVLPGRPGKSEEGWMDAFMRNGIAVDNQGGIYVVTVKNFHRVQWTGSELSLDESDGAWTVDYHPGRIGSGITPTLLGWGEGRDRLVLITSGNEEQDELQLYWRDQLPAGWTGKAGYSPRMAGAMPIIFKGEDSAGLLQEASPIAKDYGFFITDPRPAHPFAWQGSADRQIFATMAAQMLSEYALDGASKYRWDADSKQLVLDWTTDLHIYREICTVSLDDVLYCLGRRNGQWTVEGLSWISGEPEFHYTLGNSQRYNSGGGGMRLTPDGLLEYPSAMGWGIIRIRPEQ